LALAPESLADRPALRGYDGKPVIIGIRPEDFEDAAMAPDAPADRRLSAKVTLLEALGSEIMVHFRLDATTVDSGDPDAVEESTSENAANAVGRFHPRSGARMGQQIEIAVATENVHFFDHATHKAIRS
jgi:multiple sugar transport system ATP-binding protein